MGFPISVLILRINQFIQVNDNLVSIKLHCKFCCLYAAALCSDSQTNPTISRAQATLTLLGCLPASRKRLPFLLSRRKQRSAMLMNSGSVLFRLAFKSLVTLAVR